MNKITVSICFGTTCFVMGASNLEDFEKKIPAQYKDYVNVRYSTCLNCCQNNEYSQSPYVKVNGEVVSAATVDRVLEIIEKKINE